MKLFKRIAKKTLLWINLLGLDPIKFLFFCKTIPSFLKTYFLFKAQLRKSKNGKPFLKVFPILHDKYETSGTLGGQYFHQDLLVASRIYVNKPKKHIDIGSRVDGFVAHVACFREIEIFDIRHQESTVQNIKFTQADLMNISHEYYDYAESISCLHVVEHLGLGRYGDPIDANGHFTGLNNIYKILKKNGRLYLSFPIGPYRIEFNAHRIFGLSYMLDYLEKSYRIEQFSYVNDAGNLNQDLMLDRVQVKQNYNCSFGLAIFELSKI